MSIIQIENLFCTALSKPEVQEMAKSEPSGHASRYIKYQNLIKNIYHD